MLFFTMEKHFSDLVKQILYIRGHFEFI